MNVDLPEPLPPVRMTQVAGIEREIERADLERQSAVLAGIVEFDVANLDLAELLGGFGGTSSGRLVIPASLTSSCASRSAAAFAAAMMGIDCTRPEQAPTMNTSAVTALVTEPGVHAEQRHDESDRAKQDIERGLQQHHAAVGFALGSDLDVGGGSRNVDKMIEQGVAARAG